MKKLFLILFLASILISCSKDNSPTEPEENIVQEKFDKALKGFWYKPDHQTFSLPPFFLVTAFFIDDAGKKHPAGLNAQTGTLDTIKNTSIYDAKITTSGDSLYTKGINYSDKSRYKIGQDTLYIINNNRTTIFIKGSNKTKIAEPGSYHFSCVLESEDSTISIFENAKVWEFYPLYAEKKNNVLNIRATSGEPFCHDSFILELSDFSGTGKYLIDSGAVIESFQLDYFTSYFVTANYPIQIHITNYDETAKTVSGNLSGFFIEYYVDENLQLKQRITKILAGSFVLPLFIK